MYIILKEDVIQRLSDKASIPKDVGNIDYQEYVVWLAAGNIPSISNPPKLYLIVSPRQIKQALTRVDLRAAVEAAVLSGDQDLKDWWTESISFEENNPQVIAMAQALGISDLDSHNIFLLASSL